MAREFHSGANLLDDVDPYVNHPQVDTLREGGKKERKCAEMEGRERVKIS